MKTVKGEILSSTPISISKAASILSKFVSADTGASQAVCAYLRRASVSFNELKQLHKELKSHKTPKSDNVVEDREPTRSFMWNQHEGEESERKKHKKKKKKKKKKERGWFGNIVESEEASVEDKVRIKILDGVLGVKDEKKKYKKKRVEAGNLEEGKGTGKVKIEEDGNVWIEDNHSTKHKKNKEENGGKIGYLEEDKNRIKFEEDGNRGMDNGRKEHKKKRETMETREYQVGDLTENGGKIVVKEEDKKKKKKKKKRKSEEIDEGRETSSEEFWSKKKKKRKSDGES